MSAQNRVPPMTVLPPATRKERAPEKPAKHPGKPVRHHTGAGNRTLGKNLTKSFGQSPCDRPKGSRRARANPSRHRPLPVEPLSHGHQSKAHKARPQRS